MSTRIRVLVIVVGALALAEAAFAGEPAKQSDAKIRIGTYDTRAVALAYLRSLAFEKELAQLRAQADKARADGDANRLMELEKQGGQGQQRAHAQVFSNAPIDNILPKLKESMPAVAKEANVVAIVPKADWNDTSIELVDVTDLLVEQFKPTEQTRKIIAEIRGSRPMDLVEAVLLKD